MKDDAPDTIGGYPYVINQSFPQIAAEGYTPEQIKEYGRHIVHAIKVGR
jgi:hypothetical protein